MDPTPIDPDQIYAKTASGEEAMQQRTRVVQRNLRMVLILVDGNASVAELCNRTGNAQLTQNALLELELNGFIERRTEKDALWGRRPGKQSKAAALLSASEFSVYGKESENVKLPAGTNSSTPDSKDNTLSRPSQSASPAASSLTGPDSGTAFLPDSDPAPVVPARSSTEIAAPAPSLLARLLARREPAAPPDLPPLRSSRRTWLPAWPLATMLGALLLPLLLYLVALLFPYSRYLPEVEAALAQSTGQAARVDSMRVSFYPRPGLLLGDVRLGKADAVWIAELRLQPLLSTLLSSRVRFDAIDLSGIELTSPVITSMSRMLESAAASGVTTDALHVTVDQARLSFAGLGLGEMKGEFILSPNGTEQLLSLHSPDRSLQFDAQPSIGGLAVQLAGVAWRASPGSPYLFDSLNLKGEIKDGAFVIDSAELRIFGGLVQAAATLYGDRQPAITGEVSFERIDSRRFGLALGIGGQLEGEAGGRIRFSASAETWPGIPAALHADGDFLIKRGSLGGIDLPEAVRRVSTTPATLGGATRFEQLSGTIRITPGAYRFSRLVLNAGLMQSTGQFEVSQDLQLHGRMDVQMRGRADHSAKAVNLSGSLRFPQLQTLATH